MMSKKIQTIIICLLVVLSFLGTSLDVLAIDRIFTNYAVKEGLSQSTINSIFQDSFGYIWIGTADGLNRYNGYEYVKYYKSNNDEKSIVNNEIKKIVEDHNKNLWIGTKDGISKMNLNDNTITNYTKDNCKLNYLNIYDICVSSSGKVVIVTEDGMSIYDENNDDFILLDYKKYKKFSSLQSVEDDYIYGVCDGIIFKMNLETLDADGIVSENLYENLSNDTISDILVEDNNIWIGTTTKGVYKYDLESHEIIYNKKYFKEESSDISYKINQIYKYNDEEIFIATENGLISYDKDGNESTYKHSSYDKYSIANNSVITMMEDESGLMWIGTYSGISTFRPNQGVIHYGKKPNSEGQSLLGNIIHGIYEDEEGKLWIGCSGYGVTILDRKNNTYEYLTRDGNKSISSNDIFDIKGNKEKIFIATNCGIDIIDRATRQKTNISSELSSSIVHCIYVDDDNLWVGTEQGVDKIDLKDYSVENYNFVYDIAEIDDCVTNSIMKDSEGIMWFGMGINGGLIQYDQENNEVKAYRSGEENGISDNTIFCLNEDAEGNIWVGTSGGLNILNRDTNTFKVISTEHGLSNDTIYSIIFNETEKTIWVSTNFGIEHINIKDDMIFVHNHVVNTEFDANSALPISTGEVVYGGIEGLYIFTSSKAGSNDYLPELRIDTLKVNGIDVDNIDKLIIQENNNSISIKLFTTLYDNSNCTRFYYSMDEASGRWIPIEGNEITFSKLTPGKYNIRFKALNFNGTYSLSDKVFLKVKTPFKKRRLTELIYLSGIIIVIVYGYRKIKEMDNTILVKNNQLYKEMKEKNELLEKVLLLERRKNNYLINMSHELRTPLNVIYSIQQLIYDLNEKDRLNKKDVRRYVEMCYKNVHRLLKLINDLIDSTKIDAGSYNLFLEEKDIVYIVEEAALSLKSLVEQKGINLIFDTDIEECVMNIDENAIERCIVNVVNNATKFTEAGGEIFVNVSNFEDKIRIDISDTGSGIPEKNLETIFDRFSQAVNSKREATSEGSGLGLTITKRLIELHNGEIFVKSELGKGSTFTIILPKNIAE